LKKSRPRTPTPEHFGRIRLLLVAMQPALASQSLCGSLLGFCPYPSSPPGTLSLFIAASGPLLLTGRMDRYYGYSVLYWIARTLPELVRLLT
jgi:hypothetical protein